MATATLTIPDDVKEELNRFSWINWSDVARETFLRKQELEELRKRLESKEEKELTKWSIDLGRKAKKESFKRLLSKLSSEKKKELGL